jgi:hypothetical protein
MRAAATKMPLRKNAVGRFSFAFFKATSPLSEFAQSCRDVIQKLAAGSARALPIDEWDLLNWISSFLRLRGVRRVDFSARVWSKITREKRNSHAIDSDQRNGSVQKHDRGVQEIQRERRAMPPNTIERAHILTVELKPVRCHVGEL